MAETTKHPSTTGSKSETRIRIPKPTPSVSRNVSAFLNKWHRKHGNVIPHFATRTDDDPAKFKAYSFRGRELDLSLHKTTGPAEYSILVMLQNGRKRIVSDYRPHGSRMRNTFLVSWVDPDGGPLECSAIRTVAPEYRFSPRDWFNKDGGWAQMSPVPLDKVGMLASDSSSGLESSQASVPQSDAPSTQEQQPFSPLDKDTPGNCQLNNLDGDLGDKQSPVVQYDDDEQGDTEDAHEETSAEEVIHRPDSHSGFLMPQKNRVYFHLVYYRLNDGKRISRRFTLESCATIDQLYARAETVFPVHYDGLNPELLEVRIHGEPAIHINKTDHDEFQALVNRAQELQGNTIVSITVKPVMRW